MNIYQVIAGYWEGDERMADIPVFVGGLPQDSEPPGGTFSLISGPKLVSHDGVNPSRNEIWQFAGLDYHLYNAADIRELILKLMVDFPGQYDGIHVQSCIPVRNPRDLRDEIRGYWMAIQEFQIFYTLIEEA